MTKEQSIQVAELIAFIEQELGEEYGGHYDPDISKCSGILRVSKCHEVFTRFVSDPKYKNVISKLKSEKN